MIERVVPVIKRLSSLDTCISIDTRKAAVVTAALDAGADMINDVSDLEDPEMASVTAEYEVPAVIMHSLETPTDPGQTGAYDDVVEDVFSQLSERILYAERMGIDRSQLIVDPGIGFGKSTSENFALIDRLSEFRELGCPILLDHSHKSLFANVNASCDDRLPATIAATALAGERGVDIAAYTMYRRTSLQFRQ